MQIKKEEIRLKIMEVATDEFLKKGYENASMRTIAQKANTTLGNIYHYFHNKETLLEAILIPVLENIEAMMAQHYETHRSSPLTREEAIKYVENLEENYEYIEFRCFLDKRVIILLKLNSSHLLEQKEKVLISLQNHIQWHFSLDNDHYSKIVLNMLIEGVKHVLIEHECIDDAKTEFLEFFRLFCIGIIGQMK